jgi:hypothetical protein
MANEGKWTGDKKTIYFNHRLISDAKHYPENGEKGAVTYLTIVDGTKGGEDIFIDVRVAYGAEKMAGLKKGQFATVEGAVEFSIGKDGKLRGKIWNATVHLDNATRAAAAAALEGASEADDGARFTFEV